MTDTVQTRIQGRIGRITLDRPKALNAIDLPMVEAVHAALRDWAEMPAVHAVVIEGAGGRAFCAGGDIRQVRDASIAGRHDAIEAFFVAEYALNLAIARYPKPYVALIDGVCMGGGIGLSVHGTARVVTEAAMLAMPETGIGLFPDVGASFVLPRLPPGLGMLLGLTGTRVTGADAVHAGLATNYVTRARIATLADEIAEIGVAALGPATLPLPPSTLPDATAFLAPSVAAILAAADADTATTLRRMSPSAVLWSFELLRRGAGRTLEQCLDAELSLTRHATRHPDFLEGVRAMVVDKDRTPRWSPPTIEAVDPAVIAALV